MSTHSITPTFDKSTPNKVHNQLEVTGKNTVSHPAANADHSAIANESIPATVDGEYAFAFRIDTIGHAYMIFGVTSMETFDSDKEGYPGNNGMTGSGLNLYEGTYLPGDSPMLISHSITNKAKEVIVVVTIANNGAQKMIRFIVNGTPSKSHDVTADCNGDKLFPLVTLDDQNTQITAISVEQVTIRTEEVNELLEKIPKQPSTNQADNQPSSAAFAQLQQELEKERKRADLAEAQLKQATSEIAALKQQVLALQSQ